MAEKSIVTMRNWMASRAIPPKMIAPWAQWMEQTGVVDYVWAWDLLSGWNPAHLWNTDNSPSAAIIKDTDSFHDPYVLLGLAAAATTNLGISVGVNSVRLGPG